MSATILILTLVAVAPDAGSSAFDFLRINPTAREAALAGAATARSEGAFAFYYNPAHAGGATAAQFTYINYIAGMHLGSAAYTQPLDETRGIGIGIYYLNSGVMKKTDEQGEELGTFTASYAQLNLSGNIQPISGLALGVGVTGLYGALDTFYSFGIAANLGLTYDPPVPGLRLGTSVANLGVQVKPFGARDPLPLEFNLGAAWEPVSGLNLNLNLNKPRDNRLNLRLGIEGWVNQYLALRAGYSSLGSDLMKGGGEDPLAGFAAGVGVRYNRYRLDYTFVPMVILGSSHRISFGLTI